jgi:hypothetical protein
MPLGVAAVANDRVRIFFRNFAVVLIFSIGIAWMGLESQLLENPVLRERSADRPYHIRVKGHDLFVNRRWFMVERAAPYIFFTPIVLALVGESLAARRKKPLEK